MFNLVGKRYLFLIISLIVIVPGTLSLFVKGLNVGIDFAGGSSVQFRPSEHIPNSQITPIENMLKSIGITEAQVNIGNDTGTVGNQVAWVQLNTVVDDNAQTTILNTITQKYGSNVSVTFDPSLQVTRDGKTTSFTLVTIVSKDKTLTFKENDLKSLLSKLPNTSSVTSGSVTPAKTPTQPVTPKLNSTPTATATGTPSATATPATGTSNSANPPANIPVHFTNITVGSSQVTDTINILTTTTTTNGQAITKMKAAFLGQQGAFLNQSGTYLYLMSNSSVSGSVASDTIRNSILAVIAASALILLYVAFAFRKVQKPWRYGICAIIALLHDVLVVMGIFSILGWTLGIQIDALFITALLTVVGFSVHDTIVVFDRIRENMQRRSSEDFEQIVNASLVQTMSRSLNTSLTVLFTLSALTLFGGDSIRTFTLALLIGIFSGTYSSIFNASMLLVIWERGELGLWRFNREARTPDGRVRRESRERELARMRG